MKDATYKKSFELFLKRTDEKSVIERFILEHIPLHKNMDFLDIGGGEGSLAAVISRRVSTTLVVEPNKDFHARLMKRGNTRTMNERWEDARLGESTFDFILAAYVVTYFPRTKTERLIRKMYNSLRPEGRILILSVDSEKGSWRKIHSYFYKLIGHDHESSDDALRDLMKKYKAIHKSFKTHVIARNVDEMLNILGFDFNKYPEQFSKYTERLGGFLKRHSTKDGVVLDMVHNAYIITKE